MRRFRWTAKNKQIARRMSADGQTYTAIAALLGCARSTVWNFLNPPASRQVAISGIQHGKNHLPKLAPNRACMRCNRPFGSHGPHNRHCDPCRRVLSDRESDWSVAA